MIRSLPVPPSTRLSMSPAGSVKRSPPVPAIRFSMAVSVSVSPVVVFCARPVTRSMIQLSVL